jgi:hypothetical protein
MTTTAPVFGRTDHKAIFAGDLSAALIPPGAAHWATLFVGKKETTNE